MRSGKVVRSIAIVCLLSQTPAVILQAHAAAAENVEHSDREEAAQLFRIGQDAFARQDYSVAARSFMQAHALLPSGFAIYNAARAWDSVPNPSNAAAAYAEALEQADLSDAQRSHAQKRLTDLAAFVVKREAPASAPSGPLAPPTSSTAVVAAPGEGEVKASKSSNTLGWFGAGVGAGGLIATGVVGWIFLSKRSDFADSGGTNRQLRSEAVTWGNYTTAAMAITAVGAGIALWSFRTNTASAATTVAVDLTPTGLSMRGAF